MAKVLLVLYAGALSTWFLQADYYGKVWTSVLPKMSRAHSGYYHK